MCRKQNVGPPLPSIRELAASLRVNPTTIVKAYGELQHAGDIEMLHGKGAFIAQASVPKTQAEIEQEFRRIAGADTAEGSEEFAFALPPTRRQVFLVRLALAGGKLNGRSASWPPSCRSSIRW